MYQSHADPLEAEHGLFFQSFSFFILGFVFIFILSLLFLLFCVCYEWFEKQRTFIKMNGDTHIKCENEIEHWALERKKGKIANKVKHYLSRFFLWMKVWKKDLIWKRHSTAYWASLVSLRLCILVCMFHLCGKSRAFEFFISRYCRVWRCVFFSHSLCHLYVYWYTQYINTLVFSRFAFISLKMHCMSRRSHHKYKIQLYIRMCCPRATYNTWIPISLFG